MTNWQTELEGDGRPHHTDATVVETGDPDDATQLEAPPANEATELEGAAQRPRFVRRNLPEPLETDYEIVELISDSGAQADVYRARDRRDGTDVALKLYKTTHAIDDHEAALIARSDAAHVVPTDFGQWGNEKWEIQEYMPFGTLADLTGVVGHPLTNQEISEIATDLIRAVAYIHERDLAHRDIKPTNILVRQVSPLDLVLADFGLARNLMAGSQVGSITRTQGYAAPEVLHGVQSFANDWWALGITIVELCLGRHPFSYPDGRRWNEGQIYSHLINSEVDTSGVTDDRLRLLVSGLLTKDREHRWSSTQTTAWIAGESPHVHEPAQQTSASTPRGWVFAGFLDQTYHSTEDLGRAFAQNWPEAIDYLGKHSAALRNALAKSALSEEVTSAFDRRRSGIIREDGMLFELISVLDPHGEPIFRGRPLTAAGLSALAAAAFEGDTEASTWITALRRETILQHTSEYDDYAAFVGIDAKLTRWWDTVDTEVKEAKNRQQDYIRQTKTTVQRDVGNGTATTDFEASDIDTAVRAATPQLEGALLACALGDDQIARIHAQVPVIDTTNRHAPWIDALADAARDAKPADPARDILVTVLDIPARQDHQIIGDAIAAADSARREAELAEETRRRAEADRQRAEDRRNQIRSANQGVVPKLLLGLLYLVVVGFGFLLTVGDDPSVSGDTFMPLLKGVAIGTVVAVGICWLCDAILGRPLRWVLAVCVAFGFTIGWTGVTDEGTAYALPIVLSALGYAVAAVLTRYVSVLSDATTAEASLPEKIRPHLGRLALGALLGVPLAVTQMVMSMSYENAVGVYDTASQLHADAWPWVAKALSWFGGLSRLEPRAVAMWAIPCMIAYLVLMWWRQERPNRSGKYSRADAAVLALATLGMVVAILHQWTIALLFTGMIAIVGGIAALAFTIFAS
ncbi:protein kinase [Gordonia sp. NPDC062954]|uniref:serine/threonine-protein kinase n=1 Tax=Gordonia sp. NPDC062954 TaxID=3364003 RepID=UPI0037C617D6